MTDKVPRRERRILTTSQAGLIDAVMRLCAVCVLLLLLVGCAVNSRPAEPVGPRMSVATPEEFGRQFVAALAKGSPDEAMQLYISRDESARVLAASGYDRHRARVAAAVNRLAEPLAGAKFVSIYMQTRDPEMLQPGGNPSVKLATPTYRETRIWASGSGGKLLEVDGNTLVQIDGSWRFIEAPQLRGR